jgi:hypothetical protein
MAGMAHQNKLKQHEKAKKIALEDASTSTPHGRIGSTERLLRN